MQANKLFIMSVANTSRDGDQLFCHNRRPSQVFLENLDLAIISLKSGLSSGKRLGINCGK